MILTEDGIVLRGVTDIFGRPVRKDILAAADAASRAWTDGAWIGSFWSGSFVVGIELVRIVVVLQVVVRIDLVRVVVSGDSWATGPWS